MRHVAVHCSPRQVLRLGRLLQGCSSSAAAALFELQLTVHDASYPCGGAFLAARPLMTVCFLSLVRRPYGAEQQMLASSRVNSSSNSPAGSPAGPNSLPAPVLPASQLHHAAIGELLRLLRPGSNHAYANAAVTAAAAAAAAASASNAAVAAAAAVAATVPAQITSEPPAAAAPAETDLTQLQLSVEKPWDPPSTAVNQAGGKAAPSNARGAAKGRAGRSRAGGAGAGAGKKRERSRKERFMDVESFWRSCSPQQRLQLLRVPLAPLLAGGCGMRFLVYIR